MNKADESPYFLYLLRHSLGNDDMAQISVIVPVYNGETFLARCLSSIQAQIFRDFEAIIVDDGSKDRSFEIAKRFAAGDTRFFAIRKRHGGAAAARNAGIEVARGEYLAFVDADDEIDSEFLVELMRLIEDADCAVCGYHRVTQRGREIERMQASPCMISSSEEWNRFFGLLYRRYLLSSVCNKLYRRKIIEEAFLRMDVSLPIGEDLLFNLAYLTFCQRVAVSNRILYTYFHTGSTSLTAARLREKPEIDRKICRAAQSFCKRVGIASTTEIFVIYLKSCFTSIEKMVYPKCYFSKKEINQEISGILDAEETQLALSVSLSEYPEAHLYQLLLQTRSKQLLLFCVWIRAWIKAFLQQ